jgi:hypothetical protein
MSAVFVMDPRQEWIDELVRRQDNIDPIRRIPNGALFHGTLIKGSVRLNRWQRIGAIFLGLLGVTFGCFELVQVIVSARKGSLDYGSLPVAVFSPLSLWFGWRITANAFINDPKGKKTKP